MTGNVDELDLGLDGHGDIDATRLTARKAAIKSFGNCNVTVRVPKNISGTCTGNGDIVNLGSASFTADSHSSGNGRLVDRRNRD
ncbi:MAG: GIN domain-containing protein [Flavobacterium sp.]